MDRESTGVAGPSGPVVPRFSMAPDERELVAAVLRKDRKAAAQFVAAHIDAVYSYARHRLAPRA
jgi:DNA-binding GntR family transcriptional regulator